MKQYEKNTSTKELIVEAKIQNLSTVQSFISEELEASGCDMKLQMQIALVVEEIFVNIVRYAYSKDTQPFNSQKKQSATEAGNAAVRVMVEDEVVIEFEDNGKPFNPLEKSDPDITLDAQEREIGGLGIFMVKKMMDVVKYRYENSKNILTIKKHFMTL